MADIALVLASTCVALLLGELVCRVALNPVDYLEPELVHHEILGRHVRPNTGGHDAWGFRNDAVPESAQIVTIGDSMTYGHSASAEEAWPSVLRRRTGRSVYDLSLGGFCPIQYAYLLEARALSLNPEIVLAGFYLGNDLMDAYDGRARQKLWDRLRTGEHEVGEALLVRDPVGLQKRSRPRRWLARHSVLYGRVVRWSVERIRQSTRWPDGRPQRSTDEQVPPGVWIESPNIAVHLSPEYRLRMQDLTDPTRQEGLDLCLELLDRMARLCSDRGILFAVVLIPTKENVLSSIFENDPDVKYADTFAALLANERELTRRVRGFLEARDIDVIEVLPALHAGVGRDRLFPRTVDDHYHPNGYRIIGETVAEYVAGLAEAGGRREGR